MLVFSLASFSFYFLDVESAGMDSGRDAVKLGCEPSAVPAISKDRVT
jgi:hypothetical protein